MCQILSPAQLIDLLLKDATPEWRTQVLRRALVANQRQLARLTAFRLVCIEEGWDDYWLLQHERTIDTLAEIERALATC